MLHSCLHSQVILCLNIHRDHWSFLVVSKCQQFSRKLHLFLSLPNFTRFLYSPRGSSGLWGRKTWVQVPDPPLALSLGKDRCHVSSHLKCGWWYWRLPFLPHRAMEESRWNNDVEAPHIFFSLVLTRKSSKLSSDREPKIVTRRKGCQRCVLPPTPISIIVKP